MSRKKDGDKMKLAEAKYITGEPPEEIAAALNVSRRTVDRWAKEGRWDSHRQNAKNSNVIQLQPKPKVQNVRLDFIRRDGEAINDLYAVEAAIADLHASLPDAEDKSKGGIAGAIARLIELKRKLKPETIADLVERAIELDIEPEEFLTELNNAWQRRRA